MVVRTITHTLTHTLTYIYKTAKKEKVRFINEISYVLTVLRGGLR